MNLVLDVNPPKFSQDLLAIIYEPRRLLSNIIQELVIENIKDNLQPLITEGKIISLEEAPDLPLPDCDAEYCRCVFLYHPKRRK